MYTFESRIRYSETDSEGKLTIASLINYFQDCSTFQSQDLGLGVEYLREQHLVWVLSAWQIVVDRYPCLCEKVVTGTQPYDLKGFLGYRNFFMMDEEGRYAARANSLWSLLDTVTGRPVNIPGAMKERYGLGERIPMEYAPRKIQVPQEGETLEPIVVRRQHLDTNQHVNNQQFIQMALDCLPENLAPRQVRAEYKRQAFLGDVMIPRKFRAGETYIVTLEDGERKPYAVVEFLLTI